MLRCIEADAAMLAGLAARPRTLPTTSSRAGSASAEDATHKAARVDPLIASLLSKSVISARSAAQACGNAALAECLPSLSDERLLRPPRELAQVIQDELVRRIRNKFQEEPSVLGLVEEQFLPASGTPAVIAPVHERLKHLLALVQDADPALGAPVFEPEWVASRIE